MSDDDNRSSGVFGVAVSFLVLTWIVVPLRIYVRAVITKSFGLDDWLLVVTQVICQRFQHREQTSLTVTSCRPSLLFISRVNWEDGIMVLAGTGRIFLLRIIPTP